MAFGAVLFEMLTGKRAFGHLRRTLADFVAHYHGERNHQGLGNELIERAPRQRIDGPAPQVVEHKIADRVPA